jgi:hypothetical protein
MKYYLLLITAGIFSFLIFGGSEFARELNDNFESYKTETWKENNDEGNWHLQFNGYGKTGVEKEGLNKVSYLMPKTAGSGNETHSSLITSIKNFSDIDLSLRMKTIEQLRSSKPNPWETGWITWNYKDLTHFYYFILKTNGWELGKEDPAYPGAQRFLKTGAKPSLKIGVWNDIRVIQQGAGISVYVDGKLVTTFTDTERPYTDGKIGLYGEDAHVMFDDVVVTGNGVKTGLGW